MTRRSSSSRLELFRPVGAAGLRRIARSRVALVGVGALGSRVADLLHRAGVGHLRLIDRDLVEAENLATQTLYGERDVARALPKAVAAARALEAQGRPGATEAVVAELRPSNARELLQGFSCLADGTDSFEARFLLNDYAVRFRRPWVFAAAVSSYGMTGAILPGRTACLRCFLDAPPSGDLPTCDTEGLFPPVAAAVAALQAAEILKVLCGETSRLTGIRRLDLWSKNPRLAAASAPRRRPNCPACGRRRFEYLEATTEDEAVSLCGRKTVQVSPRAGSRRPSLPALAHRLRRAGRVQANPYLLRFEGPGAIRLTVFADGRLLVHGTSDPSRARALRARFLGG